MNKLITIENQLITLEISDVLTSYEIEKVKNKLLDGTYHTQNVSKPLKFINITCNITEQSKEIIDESYNIDKPLKLNWYGKYYIGLIFEMPSMEIFIKGNNNKRLYKTNFKIVVSEEGVI